MLGCNVVPPEVQMKAKSPRVGLQCLLAVCALAACSSHKGAINASSGERSESIHQARREGEKVTELDLNHDGKPDVWLYTVTAKTADGREYQRLVRKEMDINWDGKVDVVRYYDEDEQIAKEELDLDFDGHIVRKERDTNHTGRVNYWEYWENDRVDRIGEDLNGDGKVDRWTKSPDQG